MPLFGTDISTFNGDLDFDAMKRAGIRFAMAKASQGRSMNGKHYLFEDAKFRRNVEGLAKAGIPFGVYHFLTASDSAECRAEAEFFLKTVAPYRDKITLYLACDAENYGNPWLEKLSRDGLSRLISEFCSIVQSAGYAACHYTNTDHIRNFVDLDKISFPVWQAHYGKSLSKPTDAGDKLAIHQYTSSGSLSCVPGRFDLDFGYAPLAKLIVRERCGLEEQTFRFITGRANGDDILVQFADKIVARTLKPIRDPSTKRLAPLIRLHCGLKNDDISYLLGYKYADDLFRKLYTAMLVN